MAAAEPRPSGCGPTSCASSSTSGPPVPATPSPRAEPAETPAAYAGAFAEVQEQLHAGNTYEVNLTYRLETLSDLTPPEAYLRLRALNPAPYAGYLQHDVPGARAWLLSSSPERYALITADRTLETKPIKGPRRVERRRTRTSVCAPTCRATPSSAPRT